MRKKPLFSDSESMRKNKAEAVVLEQVKVIRRETRTRCSGMRSPDCVKMYEETFLSRNENLGRKPTYISSELYSRLSRMLPLLGERISVPAFLDNVLSHHLETYRKEIEEIFRRKLGEVRF